MAVSLPCIQSSAAFVASIFAGNSVKLQGVWRNGVRFLKVW